ncbi:MAG: hypothetical protein QOI88_902 [Gammaproteobacteria bacterium]|nr:hypothetical protein [Gammaproteobacteria bacterium]
MSEILIYQIHYTIHESLDPGFRVLDNLSNERSDWFEYWPIRKFLLNEPMDENSFYGFLSAKFKLKTNLSAAAVHEFVNLGADKTDVVLMSQSIHQAAYYLNTFKYGDSLHPGLLNIATQFFGRIGKPTNLEQLVTDSRNEVYSNFIIAKPRFWRAWLDINEQLFAIAESPTDPLGAELRKATIYKGRHDVQMKIFIMERIATWILSRDSEFQARVRDPFAARSRLYKVPLAIACDALKIAYVTSGYKQEYKDSFDKIIKFSKLINLMIRFADFIGVRHVRSLLRSLGSRWENADRF